MDKISGIVPASARVMSVDMKDTSPVRPGTPGFGRPEGVSSLKEPPAFGQTAHRSAAIHEQMMDWRTKDGKNAVMAAQLSDQFFLKAIDPNETPKETPKETFDRHAYNDEPMLPPTRLPHPMSSHSMTAETAERPSHPAGFKTDEFGSLRAVSSARPFQSHSSGFVGDDDAEIDDSPKLSQPEGLFPKGTFIDRSA